MMMMMDSRPGEPQAAHVRWEALVSVWRKRCLSSRIIEFVTDDETRPLLPCRIPAVVLALSTEVPLDSDGFPSSSGFHIGHQTLAPMAGLSLWFGFDPGSGDHDPIPGRLGSEIQRLALGPLARKVCLQKDGRLDSSRIRTYCKLQGRGNGTSGYLETLALGTFGSPR